MKDDVTEPEYTLPRGLSLGMPIIWRPGRTEQEQAVGFITAIGADTIDAWVLPSGACNGLPKSGVHHATDPRKAKVDATGEGIFELTPWVEYLRVLAFGDTATGLGDELRGLKREIAELHAHAGEAIVCREGLDSLSKKVAELSLRLQALSTPAALPPALAAAEDTRPAPSNKRK